MTQPRYSEQHYEDVARLLCGRSTSPNVDAGSASDVWTVLCIDFADLFAADTPRFDRDRFLKACGLEGEQDASTCDDCGKAVPADLIHCPDGAEVCQRCFDAGAH